MIKTVEVFDQSLHRILIVQTALCGLRQLSKRNELGTKGQKSFVGLYDFFRSAIEGRRLMKERLIVLGAGERARDYQMFLHTIVAVNKGEVQTRSRPPLEDTIYRLEKTAHALSELRANPEERELLTAFCEMFLVENPIQQVLCPS